MKDIRVIGHRGASGYAPENTVASFRKAMDLGVDYIELDVHLTKDGQVIVIHDASVNRTTNGTGKVCEMAAADLKKLDAGSWYHRDFAGEQLPLLYEVLQLVNAKCKVLIEIKRGDEFYTGIEWKVLEIIKNGKAETWCEVHSFHDHVLTNWRAIDTSIPLYKLLVRQWGPLYYDDGLKTGSVIKKWEGKVKGINPKGKYATKTFIEKIHQAGIQTFIWTVNSEEEMKELIKNGADGIISNYPDKVLRLIKRKNRIVTSRNIFRK